MGRWSEGEVVFDASDRLAEGLVGVRAAHLAGATEKEGSVLDLL